MPCGRGRVLCGGSGGYILCGLRGLHGSAAAGHCCATGIPSQRGSHVRAPSRPTLAGADTTPTCAIKVVDIVGHAPNCEKLVSTYVKEIGDIDAPRTWTFTRTIERAQHLELSLGRARTLPHTERHVPPPRRWQAETAAHGVHRVPRALSCRRHQPDHLASSTALRALSGSPEGRARGARGHTHGAEAWW
jgi:hypothetical protein